ncbi:MAG: hypothetical protein HPY85_15195 [Anaerolineae bacterium]|nr:hypothetical protein [Anaerolineae bacterium]
MKSISQWLYQISSGWLALVGLLVFAAFIAFILPEQARSAAQAANGAEAPDGRFFYTPRELYQTAETFGPDGRSAYILARWTFDVAWPLAYTLFLGTGISWLLKRAAIGNGWKYLNLVPLTGMVFDFLENTAVTVVMARFPQTSPVFAALAAVFTPLKWLFVNGSFVILLGAIIVGLLSRKKSPTR